MTRANKKPTTKSNSSRKDDEDLTEESENSRGPVIGEDGTGDDYMQREHPEILEDGKRAIIFRITIDPHTGEVSRTKGGPKIQSFTFDKNGKEDPSKRVTRRQWRK